MTDSLFTADDNQQIPEIDPNKNYIEELVGETKKFKTVEDLARSVLHKDAFIERLKGETNGLRQELNTKLSMEEYVDKMRTRDQQPNRSETPVNEPNAGGGNDPDKPLRPEDIEAIIDRRVSDRERARVQTQNQGFVRDKLIESFGPSYVSKLQEAGEALGLTPEDMDQMAKDRPKVFLKLVGAEAPARAQTPSLFTPPSGAGNPPRTVTGDRTKSYYDEIKKSDPKRYWSPAVQNQIHQDAIRLGERFFD